MPRRAAADVATTREAVLSAAVRNASIEGLEGLTIGRLAGELEMSKSGLFGLFGSKQDLQLATLQAAFDHFLAEVWRPVASKPAGRERLLALCDRWLRYHERERMPGGCFLTTATIEFDARPGAVRDAVIAGMNGWLALLRNEVATAVQAGELPTGTDPADVAFELNALASAASSGFQLSRDKSVFARARRLMRRRLTSDGSQA
jgi:AcrR family transcriptional regulator